LANDRFQNGETLRDETAGLFVNSAPSALVWQRVPQVFFHMRRNWRARQVGGAVAFLKQRNRLINVLRRKRKQGEGCVF
jgi:hypothetical protein